MTTTHTVADQTAQPRLAPRFVPVLKRVRETADVTTLVLDATAVSRAVSTAVPAAESTADSGVAPAPAAAGLPGRFNMLYAFGVGEIPVSISATSADGRHLLHTIRAVGPVSRALASTRVGESIGLRGPFGRGWPLDGAGGHDLLIVAGGIGMAPLRPVLHHALERRERFGRVGLLYGARTPADLLFRRELQQWRREPGLQVRVAVDRAGPDWAGDVGVITRQIDKLRFEPVDTVAMICGPEIMIRMAALELQSRGVAPQCIFVSMERNMQCAIGHCGHCQFGASFICRDGPVMPYAQVAAAMTIREL